MAAAKADKTGVLARCVLVAAYVVLVLSVSLGPISTYTAGKSVSVISTAGKCAGLIAAMMVLLQFLIAARINFFTRFAGRKFLLTWHKIAGCIAGALAGLHPLLLYGSKIYVLGSFRWQLWREVLGMTALTLLVVTIATSLGRKFLQLDYRRWLKIHQIGFAIATLASVHGIAMRSDIRISANIAQTYTFCTFTALLLLYLTAFISIKIWPPLMKRTPQKRP